MALKFLPHNFLVLVIRILIHIQDNIELITRVYNTITSRTLESLDLSRVSGSKLVDSR